MASSEPAIQGSLFAPEEGPNAQELDQALDKEPEQQKPRRRSHPGKSQPASTPLASTPQNNNELPPWHHHSLVEPAALPPMLRHYVELKAAHPERVLFYRLGDFFECFFEDALLTRQLLELTLTGKEGGKAHGRVPMAGIPHHACERYCSELVRRGYCVALCDQLETVAAKGELLWRNITRVLTPGTVLEEGMLSARRNNWLAAVVLHKNRWGLAVADVSTGEFLVREREGLELLQQELQQLEAAELLLPGLEANQKPAWCAAGLNVTPQLRSPFESSEASRTLLKRYGLSSIEGLGLIEFPLALRAAGGLISYLDASQPGSTLPLERPLSVFSGDAMVIDQQSRRNLELTATQRDGVFQGSLLWALDRTHTAMGARALRRWLEAPLLDIKAIQARQEAIALFVEKRPLRQAIRRLLRPMADLERLAGRCAGGHASARDLVALAAGLERLPLLADLIKQGQSEAKNHAEPLLALQQPRPDLQELAALLQHQLIETPPRGIANLKLSKIAAS